ncbi:MAG: hypothetical protein V1697_00620 [Candidatus Levyibacteriota bacterium]
MKKRKPRFPRISRFITEKSGFLLNNKYSRVVIYSLIYISLISITVYLGLNFYNNYNTQKELSLEREKVSVQIKVWQGVIDKYPNFKDAYLQLAVLEYRVGNINKSRVYVKKALVLDPEYSDAIELDKKLRGN